MTPPRSLLQKKPSEAQQKREKAIADYNKQIKIDIVAVLISELGAGGVCYMVVDEFTKNTTVSIATILTTGVIVGGIVRKRTGKWRKRLQESIKYHTERVARENMKQ